MQVPLLVAAVIGLVAGMVLHHRFRPTHHRRGDRGGFFLLAILLAGVAAGALGLDAPTVAFVATGGAACCLVLATHPPTDRHVHLPHRHGHRHSG